MRTQGVVVALVGLRKNCICRQQDASGHRLIVLCENRQNKKIRAKFDQVVWDEIRQIGNLKILARQLELILGLGPDSIQAKRPSDIRKSQDILANNERGEKCNRNRSDGAEKGKSQNRSKE